MNNLPLFDALAGVPIWAVVVGVLLVLAVLGFTGARLWIWTVASAVALYGFGAPVWLWGVYVVLALLFNVPPIRRALISAPLMKPNTAVALGHPLGCTGAKLTATLLHEMKRRGVRYGLCTMCIGGGMGAAAVIENLMV